MDHEIVGDVFYLDCDNDYMALSSKVRAFFLYVNVNIEAEFVGKCDELTYLWTGPLLEQIIAINPDYMGIARSNPKLNRYWHSSSVKEAEKKIPMGAPFQGRFAEGGPGYVLSRKVVGALSKVKDEIDPTVGFYEDKYIGDSLRLAEIELTHCDRFLRVGSYFPKELPSITLKCKRVAQFMKAHFFGTDWVLKNR